MGQIIQFLPGSRTIDSVILLHIGACRTKGTRCADYGLMTLWSCCFGLLLYTQSCAEQLTYFHLHGQSVLMVMLYAHTSTAVLL